MTHLMQSHTVGQDYLRKRSWIIELSTIEVSMVMHMSRHQKGYGVRREGKMGGGLEREQKKPLFLFPFYPFLPPPSVPPLICAWHAGYWQSQVQWNHRCISCAFPCMRLSLCQPSLRVHHNDTNRKHTPFFCACAYTYVIRLCQPYAVMETEREENTTCTWSMTRAVNV